MATSQYDPREAKRLEQEYAQQLMSLKTEVEQLEADAREIPKEVEESRRHQRELETKLRTVTSTLASKRRELDEMTRTHHDIGRGLTRH